MLSVRERDSLCASQTLKDCCHYQPSSKYYLWSHFTSLQPKPGWSLQRLAPKYLLVQFWKLDWILKLWWMLFLSSVCYIFLPLKYYTREICCICPLHIHGSVRTAIEIQTCISKYDQNDPETTAGLETAAVLSATLVFQLALVAESVPGLVRVRGILNLKDICVRSA